ncbi:MULTISPECIES: MFS transporter [unclassified Frondihabitans]|uniref:MFS transporter n=1 Tax=unclassified Frondihabitans TaxID=2626248 RepID=UPI000F4F14D2|nr:MULTISPECIES: MFS transporter [unclassified Frondihabitans]RPE78172.1 UMF1 family MFS transporter [Frondihabitans sp. PhB153]RPF08453.1 UMF1 family MFS transporter [Frondihabitans sp. PhB161]
MTQATLADTTPVPRRRIVSWALWDAGSAGFNTIVITFVFSTYLASNSFVSPDIVAAAGSNASNAALVAAKAHNASVVSTALTVAGLLIALLAPLLGQRSDGTGKRKLWLGVNTGIVIVVMIAMVFVAPIPSYLLLGACLLALGSVVIEFANVNYNAMLVQVSTPKNVGRVSSWGWGAGYLGGIVLLVILLVLFIQSFGVEGHAGLLGLDSSIAGGVWTVRFAILASAAWFALFAVPLFLAVPEMPPTGPARERLSVLGSYRRIGRTIAELYRKNPQVLLFLAASAVYRDGIAAVFTFGAIIAAVVFGFTPTEVLYFAVAANVVAGTGAFLAGRLDDRLGAKTIIVVCVGGLVVAAVAILFVGDGKAGFWACGLFLSLFVGPAQSSSRSFLARVTPPGREGEIFGLYATTGRAVSFLAPALFTLFVTLTGDTRFGAIGIAIVLTVGLVLMTRVHATQRAID